MGRPAAPEREKKRNPKKKKGRRTLAQTGHRQVIYPSAEDWSKVTPESLRGDIEKENVRRNWGSEERRNGGGKKHRNDGRCTTQEKRWGVIIRDDGQVDIKGGS